jgi:hypothetical protein
MEENMRCTDLKLLLYGEPILDERENFLIESHLRSCPNCRHRLMEVRILTQELKHIEFSNPSEQLIRSVKRTVTAQINSNTQDQMPSENLVRWLQFHFLPYFIGVTLSLLIFSSFLLSLFSTGGQRNTEIEIQSTLGYSQPSPMDRFDEAILEYAAARRGVSMESPSINPSGSLMSLAPSVSADNLGNKEIVVVAEVFSDGMARIEQVINPPKNRQLLKNLEAALQQNQTSPAFLPASLDNRSSNVRVVLKIHGVEIIDRVGKKPRQNKGI